MSVMLLLGALISQPMRRMARVIMVALSLILLGGASSMLLDTEERMVELTDVTAMSCAQSAGTEVCVFPDHERFLPALLAAAGDVTEALPPDSRPVRFVEQGLRSTPDDAMLSTPNVPAGPAEAVLNGAAEWRVCVPEVAIERFSFLALRTELSSTQDESIAHVMVMSEAQQIQWWRQGATQSC